MPGLWASVGVTRSYSSRSYALLVSVKKFIHLSLLCAGSEGKDHITLELHQQSGGGSHFVREDFLKKKLEIQAGFELASFPGLFLRREPGNRARFEPGSTVLPLMLLHH